MGELKRNAQEVSAPRRGQRHLHPPAACTIVARNYLPYARILAQSYFRHEPNGAFYLLVVDGLGAEVDAGPGITVVQPRELNLPYFFELCFKYDVTELSTAVKPTFLRLLMERFGHEQVIFFDPDILIARPLVELKSALRRSSIVLTPHLLKPLPADQLKPSEQDILRDGIFNLGFVALRKTPTTDQFLLWWEARLRNGCRIDRDGGLFTDQKWVDLVPVLFPDTTILLDPTYNVAYWNVATRSLAKRNGQFLVDDRPLAFFHFSGFRPDTPTILSKHENRTTVEPGSPLGEILELYSRMHGKHESSDTKPVDYGYSRFKNGISIHSIMRQVYFDLGDAERARFADPIGDVGPGSFFDWATRPQNGSPLSPFLEKIYSLRYDVAAAYPDARDKDRAAFFHWATTSGPKEMGYDLQLVNPAVPTSDAPAAPHVEPKVRPFGLNIIGYFRNESGLGFSTRAHVRAIQSLGVPVALRDVSGLSVNRSQDDSFTTFHDESPYDLNLICINADQHFNVAGHLGEAAFDGRYNIGVWWWELPRFPEQWHDRFAHYSEIWAGSAFVAAALSEVSPIPIVRIPPVMTGPYTSSREAGRRKLNVGDDEFLFAFTFDFHSYFQRKNPLAAIAAFRKAFKPDDRVRLVIKCTNSKIAPVEMSIMQAAAAGYPIDIHDGYWPAQDMRDLTAACDACVSLHRSEGFGQTIAEAMALGKPAIATAWSGNMDFMTAANSYPVDYQLTQLTGDFGPYRKGETWAEPSVDHAAQMMRAVVDHPSQARKRGAQGRRDIEANFSESAVAAIIKDRLNTIAALRKSTPAQASRVTEKPKHVRYREMIGRIRDLVAEHVPTGAVLAVISRGDDALLQLDGRTAWHFPQTGQGQYAGYHPKDSATAIAHLRALAAKGATHLLLPETAFWWREHYGEFQGFLDANCRLVARNPDTCLIYAIDTIPAAHAGSGEMSGQTTAPTAGSKITQAVQIGVNIAGHFQSEKGVGEGARSDVRALQAVGVPIVLTDAPDTGSVNSAPPPLAFSTDNPHPVNLVHFNPDQLPQFTARVGENYFHGKYNIGFWAWELSQLPDEWLGGFEHFQEIWVPSSFTLDAVAPVSPVPVVKMPHCLPVRMPMASVSRAKFGLDQNKFLFLFMFDFHSSLDRKNPVGLIRAFKSAFKQSDDAMLILKTSHSSPAAIASLKREIGTANIRIIDQVMDRAHVNALVKTCDCYVSLHRSEGFGLTMAEAMAMGKPVIATAYSGNVDFMTAANSFLVDFTLIRVARDQGSYRKGNQWADPNLEHAASLMRQVYQDRDGARAVGLRAKQQVRQMLSPAVIGARMQQRLLSIRWPVSSPAPIVVANESTRQQHEEDLGKAKQAQYRQLVERIRGAIDAHAPKGSTIAVISRGDSDLLDLKNLKACHFFADAKGGYLGYHPPDGSAAIARLESLRATGTEYLLIPEPAFWWLTHYPEFRLHLTACYPLVLNTDDFLLYRLAGKKAEDARRDRLRLELAMRVLSPLQEAHRLTESRVTQIEESAASYASGGQMAELAASLGNLLQEHGQLTERITAKDAAINAQALEIEKLASAKTELADAVGALAQQQQRWLEHAAEQNEKLEAQNARIGQLASTNTELSETMRGLIERNQHLFARAAANDARVDAHDTRFADLGGIIETTQAEVETRVGNLEQATESTAGRLARQESDVAAHLTGHDDRLSALDISLEQIRTALVAAENQFAEQSARTSVAHVELENQFKSLEQLTEGALGHLAQQGSDAASHLSKHDEHLGSLDVRFEQIHAAMTAAENRLAEQHAQSDLAKTELQTQLRHLEQMTGGALGHLAQQGSDASSHLSKHDEHLGALDVRFEQIHAAMAAAENRLAEQHAQSDLAKTELETQLRHLEQMTGGALGHLAQQGSDASSHLSKHDEHLGALDTRFEHLRAAMAAAENQLAEQHARTDSTRTEHENRLSNLEQVTERAVDHMARQGSDASAHLAKHDEHLGMLDGRVEQLANLAAAQPAAGDDRAGAQDSRIDQLSAAVAAAESRLAELHARIDTARTELENQLRNLGRTAEGALEHLARQGSDASSHLAKHDEHLGALDGRVEQLANLGAAQPAAEDDRAGAQDSRIDQLSAAIAAAESNLADLNSRTESARKELENRLTNLERITDSAVDHMARMGSDTSSHLAKHDAHLGLMDVNFEELLNLVSEESAAGTEKAAAQDAGIEQLRAAVASAEEQFAELRARSETARTELENKLHDLQQVTEGAVGHMARQGSDTSAHLSKHDAHLGDLDSSMDRLAHLLEAQERTAREFSRLVNGKLGELGELPQAVTARISGLESRLGRMAKSSEMWLNELTKLTADLSDRINRRQNPASPPVVANDPDAEARR